MSYKVFSISDFEELGSSPGDLAKADTGKPVSAVEIARLSGIEFSPSQAEAATHANGVEAILASAGSGKTAVLAARIASLVRTVGPHAEKDVFATSFTREATRNLRSRVRGLLGRESLARISTFHSIAQDIVFAHLSQAGYGVMPTVLTRSSADMRLKSVILEVTGASKLSELDEFSVDDIKKWMYGLDAKALVQGIKDEDLRDFLPPSDHMSVACRVHQAYHRINLEDAVMDFDEILTKALSIIIKQGAWAFPAKHVFVDEAQDLNAIQWETLRLARPRLQSLVMIGDDDQSVYRFRGARPREFLAFVKTSQRTHILPENRRSLSRIVALSDNVMSVVPADRRVPRTIVASRAGEGDVFFVSSPNVKELLSGEVEKIARRMKTESDLICKEYAFLQRYSGQTGKMLQGLLLAAEIPYIVRGGGNVFEDAEAQYVKAVVAAIDRRYKLVNAERVGKETGEEVSTPPVSASSTFWDQILDAIGVSPDAAGKIIAAARKDQGNGRLFEERLQEAAGKSRIKGDTKSTISRTVDIILKCTEAVTEDPRRTFKAIVTQTEMFDIVAHIAGVEARRIAAGRKKRGGLTEERTSLLASELSQSRRESIENALGPVMDMPLSEVNARFEIDDEASTGEQEGRPRVVLSTVHSAKGLEWKTVYMLDVADGVWPPAWTKDDVDDLDEERRLFYVAITRARDTLIMLSPGPSRDEAIEFSPVPFLDKRIGKAMSDLVRQGQEEYEAVGLRVPTMNELKPSVVPD